MWFISFRALTKLRAFQLSVDRYQWTDGYEPYTTHVALFYAVGVKWPILV